MVISVYAIVDNLVSIRAIVVEGCQKISRKDS
jgi:hypothetical protein